MSISSRIEYVQDTDLLNEEVPSQRPRKPGLDTRRRLTGLALAALGMPLVTLLLNGTRDTLSLEGEVLIYLLAVVVVALVGGVLVALLTAAAAAVLINYYFVEPLHTFGITHGDQAISLGVFVIVAGVVSGAVELAARRARAAEHASAQTDTLSSLAGGDLDEAATLRNVLSRARDTFGMQTVVLKVRDRTSGTWRDVESAGWCPPGDEAPLQFDVPVDRHLRLIGRGPALFAEDHRILHAFASAAQTAYEGRRLTERAREGRDLATVDRQRSALLAAAGHDLRTPLAAIKTSVTTLRQTAVDSSDTEREELLATIQQSAVLLEGVVGNLLDASRLQAGTLTVEAVPVALDEVVAAAVATVPGVRDIVVVDVSEDLPPVLADRGLLERVLVNLLDNAVRHAGSDKPIEIRAYALSESAKLEVIDHGPGVPSAQREVLFVPFQPLDDGGSVSGVGLGLSVARGFAEAMGGALAADDSPGSGLTMRLRLRLAGPQSVGPAQPAGHP